MPLAVGTRIGAYEVSTLLGKGGMGEVYRATDLKLKREVAVKVLPAALGENRERMQRFMREAEVLASLNHPNIAQIYGLEESGDTRAIVMELVEGETLAEIIKRGPIPLDTAINYAKQILSAFEYAHDKPRPVIHRDLKPANVKVTPEGVVKVLDFGLAKALAEDRPESADPEMSPTLTLGPTVVGVILGTASYMSPEQAKGKSADRRSDIWSFGAMLYEMTTGEKPFSGPDQAEVLAAVITKDPDLSLLPARVRPAVERCLRKDPRKRWYSMEDIRFALDEPFEASSQVIASASAPSRRLSLALGVAAGAFALIAAGLAFIHFGERVPEPAAITTTILHPEGTTLDAVNSAGAPPALSPDGKRIVFGARDTQGRQQLWLRLLASTVLQPLSGTEEATWPFWSPDSRYIAFFQGGKLKKIDTAGGPPIAIADAPQSRGGSWSPEGVIVFAPGPAQGVGSLMKVAAAGGSVTAVTSPKTTKSQFHRLPWFLPDGRHFLFEDSTIDSGLRMRAGSLDSAQTVDLGPADSNPVYSNGHILFLRQDTLMAQPFDLKRLATTGDAAPLQEDVAHLLSGGRAGAFTVSATGLLAFQKQLNAGSQTLTWFDRQGKQLETVGKPADMPGIEFSPDRRSLAVQVATDPEGLDIWIYDMARGTPARFTFGVRSYQPIWSPDGKTIAYRTQGSTNGGLYRKAANGEGKEELLYEDRNLRDVTSWSPDGKYLLMNRFESNIVATLLFDLSFKKPGELLKPRTLLADAQFSQRSAVFSPDGHWIAYVSDESRKRQVYVVPFPGPGGKRQISTAGGDLPRWRHDGKEIFFIGGEDGKITAAEVMVKGASLEVGAVHDLDIPAPTGRATPYDVSLDGQRILVASVSQRAPAPPLTLVENWTALLKK